MNPDSPYFTYPLPGIAEPMSAISHLFAAFVFAVMAFVLVRQAGSDRRRARAIKLYACSVVALLLTSGIYHLFSRDLVIRDVLQRLDHATIFVVIASTFTAIHTVLLEGLWRSGV